MITAALVFAGLAGLLHVYIFTMESLTWTSERTRAAFGTTPEEAETTKLLAFNQGFYNLFLAIVTGVGIGALPTGAQSIGASLIFAGVGSMAAAAVVLAGLGSGQGPSRADAGHVSGDRRGAVGERTRLPLILIIPSHCCAVRPRHRSRTSRRLAVEHDC